MFCWLCFKVLGSEGTEEAIIQAQLVPCTSTGLYVDYKHTHTHRHTFGPSSLQQLVFPVIRPLGEDDILIDPSELLGRRLDFQLVLDQCCGLRWIREAFDRGVQIG